MRCHILNFKIAEKIRDIFYDDAKLIVTEGTTASGKTTGIGTVCFMCAVEQSNKKLHLIMSKTTGTAEKNIIASDAGIMSIWDGEYKYMGRGSVDYKFPHLIKNDGSKIIMIIGYDNKPSQRNILGSQFGVALVDEGNTAQIETLRELMTRADKLYFTNNPDAPDLPYFTEIVNHCVDKTPELTPPSIQADLIQDKENWHYYFFDFNDNPSLTPEKIEEKKSMLEPTTKIYKNKILGLRCRAVGLVFNMRDEYYINSEDLPRQFDYISIGVDTAYSSKSDDLLAVVVVGIADGVCYVLDEYAHNNRDGVLAPSDFVPIVADIVTRYNQHICFVDSADQSTMSEARKIRPDIQWIESYKQTKIVDRINLMNGWLWNGSMKIVRGLKNLDKELNSYSWQENKDIPEDGNDHMINALQYAFLPYKEIIKNY